MTHPSPEQIAQGLTEARRLLTRVTLVVTHSEPQRLAFIAGLNGDDVPPHASAWMRRDHALGLEVRAHLQSQEPSHG